MRVWITKWLFSYGIMEDNCGVEDGWVYFSDSKNRAKVAKLGTTAFLTREEAKAKAEEMKRKKIASLNRQIDSLKLLKFDQVSVAGRMVD